MGALRQTVYFIWPYNRNFHMFLLLITHWKASKAVLICYNNYRSIIKLYKETFPYFQYFGVDVKVVHFLWHIYRKLSFMIVLYCWILNYLVLSVYFSGTVLGPIGDITMTKWKKSWFFYLHYIREISKIVYKKICQAIHLQNLMQSCAISMHVLVINAHTGFIQHTPSRFFLETTLLIFWMWEYKKISSSHW